MAPVHDRAGDVNIKPIPTRYAGVYFRSRLEARVAATLDACRVAWQYESEAYTANGIAYLPDLVVGNAFCEIKPTSPWSDPTVCEKIGALAESCDVPCYLLYPGESHLGYGQSLHQIRVRGTRNFASAVLSRCPQCGIGQFWTIGEHLCSACGLVSATEDWWGRHYAANSRLVYPDLPQYQDGRMLWPNGASR